MAENYRANLILAYVFTPGVEGQTIADREFWRKELESVRPTNSKIPVTHVFMEGDPAEEIVRYADDAGIDVIVMGTHGRTAQERQLMGSVAERVMRDAPCSVLVVKMPRGSQNIEPQHVALAEHA